MENVKSLAELLAKMQIDDNDNNGSIRIWHASDKKWYVAAMVGDNWMVVSAQPGTDGVKDALNMMYDLANDFIDTAEAIAKKSGRFIDFSDTSIFDEP